MSNDTDNGKVVKAYQKIKAAREALAAEFKTKDDELKEKQERLQNYLLDFLNRSGLQNAATETGIFYKQEDIIPTGADWSKFYAWVKENDAFDALEKRITRTFVKSWMDDHDGTPPPGVSVFRKYKVAIRKK